MNKSTIPYSIVEERRRLNKCIENAPNECEREIYRKIRDMKIPYDKLDTIDYFTPRDPGLSFAQTH